MLHEEARIFLYSRMLNDSECDHIIKASEWGRRAEGGSFARRVGDGAGGCRLPGLPCEVNGKTELLPQTQGTE